MRRWNDEVIILRLGILPSRVCQKFAHIPPSLAGEILAKSLAQLERDIHPVVIISAYNKALKESLEIINKISIPINTSSDDEMLSLIKTSIGTKFVACWSDLMCRLALQAVRTVATGENGHKTVDIKRYARVEKIALVGRRSPKQGHHPPQYVPENTTSAHSIVGLSPGIQKGRKSNKQHGVFQGERLGSSARNRGRTGHCTVQTLTGVQARPGHHRKWYLKLVHFRYLELRFIDACYRYSSAHL